ncbi:hypothetical protein SNEBB_009247 [Seison nebaliae]|nr:hypothetical protein SNEBB_009247 [Seison nebaliae]
MDKKKSIGQMVKQTKYNEDFPELMMNKWDKDRANKNDLVVDEFDIWEKDWDNKEINDEFLNEIREKLKAYTVAK